MKLPCNDCNKDCLNCREYLNYSGKESENIALYILNKIDIKRRNLMGVTLKIN